MSNILTNEAMRQIVAETARQVTEICPHLDFRTAVRRVLGTGEWRSDEDRINAAEAKRQRRMERNLRNQRPKEVTRNG